MPQYFFKIRGAEHAYNDDIGVPFDDDAAALDYACRIVRELRASGGYDDPRLVVDVTNEGAVGCSQYPFLPPAPEARHGRVRRTV